MQLVIAEKPNVAMSIAAVLGADKRQDGYMEGNGYLVGWCVGHLAGLADASHYGDYKKWRYEDLPILPETWQTVIAPDKKEPFDTLKKLMEREDVTELVCATDAGREGELIFRFVYEKAGCQKPFYRLWISSMEESAIKKGFEDLRAGHDYDNLYQSALCRAKADWLIGINATRLFSVLYNHTLNVGRVQTPTLSLETIRSTASELIAEIDRNFAELTKTVEQEKGALPEKETAADKDTYTIYQLKDNTPVDYHFRPLDELQAKGLTVTMTNYEAVYTAPIEPGTGLEDIYTKFNIDHPEDFKGHSLSVSDVVVLHQNGQDTAHYVDSYGFQKVPEFTQPENYLKAAEQSTEQNANMIDGQINNTPSVDELEAKVKAGEQISLIDLAEAIKNDKATAKSKPQKPGRKSSIRKQLKEDKENAKKEPKKQAAKTKNKELEV